MINFSYLNKILHEVLNVICFGMFIHLLDVINKNRIKISKF
jgi:hypothetical protein